jgi:hypothetical protein
MRSALSAGLALAVHAWAGDLTFSINIARIALGGKPQHTRSRLMMRVVWMVGLVTMLAVVIAACGGTPEAPTQAPANTSAPAATSTTAPAAATATTAPAATATTAASTAAPANTSAPAASPTAEGSREQVSFSWAPGSVPPADADDGAEIVAELMTHEGVLSGVADEAVLNVTYDPDLITVEEIMEIMDQMGHPVIQQ